MGPGWEQGDNQIETRFHQGLSWRPSWAFRWPGGLSSKVEDQPVESVERGGFWPRATPSGDFISSLACVVLRHR